MLAWFYNDEEENMIIVVKESTIAKTLQEYDAFESDKMVWVVRYKADEDVLEKAKDWENVELVLTNKLKLLCERLQINCSKLRSIRDEKFLNQLAQIFDIMDKEIDEAMNSHVLVRGDKYANRQVRSNDKLPQKKLMEDYQKSIWNGGN